MDFVSDFSGLFDFGDEQFSIEDLYKDHVFSQEFLDFTLGGGMIPQAKTSRRVMDPAVVVLEAVTESPANQSGCTVSGEISVTKLSSETHKKRSRESMGIFIDHEISSATENDHNVKMGNSEALSVSKEPSLDCPICLSPFSEACSTNCGHIFCQACIKVSIKAQKKCPTCRKKLTMRSFHRVYLPSGD